MREVGISDLELFSVLRFYSKSAFIRVNPRLILICDLELRDRNKTLSDRGQAKPRFCLDLLYHFSSLD